MHGVIFMTQCSIANTIQSQDLIPDFFNNQKESNIQYVNISMQFLA